MSRLAFADLLLRNAAALVIVKATAVLAFATAAAAIAKGLSAARQHTLWLVALSSCVWLILSSPVVPTIMIHTPILAQKVVAISARPTAGAPPSSRNAALASAPRVWKQFPATETVRRTPLRSIPLPSHPLIALWIIGFVALLVRHALGFVDATRLARHAFIANDDDARRELASVTAALGVKRKVRLGYSTEVRTPITLDVTKPYVLLPTEAKSWSIERRRAVLVHETAHIARGDWLSQAIGQLACELFWFHPLVWHAFARLRDEAERAADDCVLRSGMPAFEYATHLLELARRSSNARPDLVAIGIVSTNDLERRFVAMFDTKRSRTTVTSRARAVTASFALAIVCPLASLRVAPPAPQGNAPLPYVPLQLTTPPRVSTAQPSSATRAAAGERDTARVSRTANVGAAIVGEPAPEIAAAMAPERGETSPAPIAVVDHPARSPGEYPDLSGRWRVDSVASPSMDSSVNDSTIITQYGPTISFESRGHDLDRPTYVHLHEVWFDGAESPAFTVAGDVVTNFVASAVWVGDTLILTSHVQERGHAFHTIERMTLSPDRNTLFDTNLSFVDGNYRWGGPHTFVLRRMAP